MNGNKLSENVSYIFIISHMLMIFLIITFRFLDYYDDKTIKIALPILIPLFATYTMPIIKNIIKNKHRNNNIVSNLNVNKLYAFISFSIPVCFAIFVFIIIVRQAFVPFAKEDFAFYLGISESIFGVMLGLIMKSMF